MDFLIFYMAYLIVTSIECTNGNSYSDLSQKSNGFWYSGASNMGDDYKGLSINGVAEKKCN
jgi:hypothetical protein